MRVSRQFVTFGVMVLVGGAFLPISQAQAFGQQWRPTITAAPAPTTNYPRVVNLPSVRPHVSAASPRLRMSRTRTMQPTVAMPPPVYPRPAYQRAGYGAPNVRPSMPMWSNPFAQMAPIWQNPMPVYPRQAAWRPIEQPRMTQRTRPQRVRVRYANPMPLADLRARNALSGQHGMGRAPAWRRPNPAAASSRFASGHAAAIGYRPVPGRYAPVRTMPAPQISAAGMQRGYWRSDQAATAPRFSYGESFRPAAYGLSGSHGRQPAQQGGFARNLPGWATTYQDTANLLVCDWCSDS